jgi:threonine/homoserine/homoserine lactone efflux protein
MGTTGIILLILILGGGAYFAYWGIQRTLAEDVGKNRNQKRAYRKRR